MAVEAFFAARRRISIPFMLAAIAGLVALLPLLGVITTALFGETADIAARDIFRYAATSAWLALFVGGATAVLGTLAAWLIVMHRFPGSDIFAWALALPLAVPAFALAYAYTDLFDVAGPLRMTMRGNMGFDLPFGMRGLGGAVFVLSFAFYPYVYLAMRAAFLNQSVNVTEAARTLGCDGWLALYRVALPMARPALAAGVALAVMETLADYGAVQFLNVQTLTTGIVRAWSVYGSTVSAARLALPLLATAALLLWIERRGRPGRLHEAGNARWRTLPVKNLSGRRAWLASAFCLLLITAGLLLPVGWLLFNALDTSPDWTRLLRAGSHSLMLGIMGSAVTVALATMLALGTRRLPMAARLASLGYATPGAVMAIGLLVPAGIIWNLMPDSGYIIAIALLIYAYAARLMAAALEPIDAGLTRVTPSMIHAARSLGRSETSSALAVELPVARGAMLTASLIVFIDVLKELPATLILRPFDFDTLAVVANNYALDERLEQAGTPSILIILLSLPAVIWLTRKIAFSRPGT
ncbi:iron ABC transporter permease [Parasphingorhabdus sp. JC815]|uniref:ABC transporter permease n=1 Tax=Parasphingorhabdus sp. JC815 TaxID=3232140 RepID=UPI0034596E2C